MAPRELKIYILHDLYVASVVSILPRSKTAYLATSKNPPISRLEKKCGERNMKLIEIERMAPQEMKFFILRGLCSEYGFGTLRV